MVDVTASAMGVFVDLIGQSKAITELRRAVSGEGHSMTHAWLFTGPPGSGRSIAARAFAAALECESGGCGECQICLTAVSGNHPDVTLVRTEAVNIGVDEIRELIRKAAMAPALGRYQILVVEDADRITDRGADALLKSIEEPASRTVWLLCAPTAEDVIVTIRSRCRKVDLVTPNERAISELLQRRDRVDREMADWAARVCGGHVGRARLLAQDPSVRASRAKALSIPPSLTSLKSCLTHAQELIESTKSEAESVSAEIDERETALTRQALGADGGLKPRNTQAVLKELADKQKMRAKRLQRDALDRALTDMSVFFRDVLVTQLQAGAILVNQEISDDIVAFAQKTTSESTLVRLEAISKCREALGQSVAPLLAIQSLFISLKA